MRPAEAPRAALNRVDVVGGGVLEVLAVAWAGSRNRTEPMTIDSIKLHVQSIQSVFSQHNKDLAVIKPFVDELISLTSPPYKNDLKSNFKYNLEQIKNHVSKYDFNNRPNDMILAFSPVWVAPILSQIKQIESLLNNLDESKILQVINSTKQETHLKNNKSNLKIFISHTHDDQKLAKSLIRLLRDSLDVTSEDIRCTSVAGSDLNAGDNFNEKLQRETIDSQVFIVLLTHKSLESVYVTFELGARWGSKQRIFPLKVKSVPYSAIKGPLTALHIVSADERANIIKVIDDIAKELRCKTKPSSSYQDELDDFIKLASILKKEKMLQKNEPTSNVGPAISAPPVIVGPAIPPRGKRA